MNNVAKQIQDKIDTLSDEQLKRLYAVVQIQLLTKEAFFINNVEKVRFFLRNANLKLLIKAFTLITIDFIYSDLYKIDVNHFINNFDEIKQKLDKLDLKSIQPKRLPGLLIKNKNCGVCYSTIHAFNRFTKYYYKDKGLILSDEKVIKDFKTVFFKAIQGNIKAVHNTLRLITNDYKPSIYLFNHEANLRFVVEENTKSILTCEPISKKKSSKSEDFCLTN